MIPQNRKYGRMLKNVSLSGTTLFLQAGQRVRLDQTPFFNGDKPMFAASPTYGRWDILGTMDKRIDNESSILISADCVRIVN